MENFQVSVVDNNDNIECVLVIGMPTIFKGPGIKPQLLIARGNQALERGDRVLTKREKFNVILAQKTCVNKQELNFLKAFFQEIEHVKIKNLNYMSMLSERERC